MLNNCIVIPYAQSLIAVFGVAIKFRFYPSSNFENSRGFSSVKSKLTIDDETLLQPFAIDDEALLPPLAIDDETLLPPLANVGRSRGHRKWSPHHKAAQRDNYGERTFK